jgi:Uracil phosphoribosyltransferase
VKVAQSVLGGKWLHRIPSKAMNIQNFVHWIDHPLVQHKLTLMRKKDASTNSFRTLLNELSMLMAYEVTRDMEVSYVTIETPLETMQAPTIDGKKLAIISILRAGTGILDGMLKIVPGARVGHVGLYSPTKHVRARCNCGGPDAGNWQFSGRGHYPDQTNPTQIDQIHVLIGLP